MDCGSMMAAVDPTCSSSSSSGRGGGGSSVSSSSSSGDSSCGDYGDSDSEIAGNDYEKDEDSDGDGQDGEEESNNVAAEVTTDCLAQLSGPVAVKAEELRIRAVRLRRAWEGQLRVCRRLVREVKHSRRTAELIRREMTIAEKAASSSFSSSQQQLRRRRCCGLKSKLSVSPMAVGGFSVNELVNRISSSPPTPPPPPPPPPSRDSGNKEKGQRNDFQLTTARQQLSNNGGDGGGGGGTDGLSSTTKSGLGGDDGRASRSYQLPTTRRGGRRPIDNLTNSDFDRLVGDVCARFAERPTSKTHFLTKSCVRNSLLRGGKRTSLEDAFPSSEYELKRFIARVRNRVYRLIEKSYSNDASKLSRERNIPLHVAKIVLDRASVIKRYQRVVESARRKVSC